MVRAWHKRNAMGPLTVDVQGLAQTNAMGPLTMDGQGLPQRNAMGPLTVDGQGQLQTNATGFSVFSFFCGATDFCSGNPTHSVTQFKLWMGLHRLRYPRVCQWIISVQSSSVCFFLVAEKWYAGCWNYFSFSIALGTKTCPPVCVLRSTYIA